VEKPGAEIRCERCGRRCGVVWFGRDARLVDLGQVLHQDPGPLHGRYLVLIHQCPEAGTQVPPPAEVSARADGGPPGRNGGLHRKTPLRRSAPETRRSGGDEAGRPRRS
jgi:hypothetical protein